MVYFTLYEINIPHTLVIVKALNNSAKIILEDSGYQVFAGQGVPSLAVFSWNVDFPPLDFEKVQTPTAETEGFCPFTIREV